LQDNRRKIAKKELMCLNFPSSMHAFVTAQEVCVCVCLYVWIGFLWNSALRKKATMPVRIFSQAYLCIHHHERCFFFLFVCACACIQIVLPEWFIIMKEMPWKCAGSSVFCLWAR
jgi:hypothetical protein